MNNHQSSTVLITTATVIVATMLAIAPVVMQTQVTSTQMSLSSSDSAVLIPEAWAVPCDSARGFEECLTVQGQPGKRLIIIPQAPTGGGGEQNTGGGTGSGSSGSNSGGSSCYATSAEAYYARYTPCGPSPEEQLPSKSCADGSTVAGNAECPQAPNKSCADGSTVAGNAECPQSPKKEEPKQVDSSANPIPPITNPYNECEGTFKLCTKVSGPFGIVSGSSCDVITCTPNGTICEKTTCKAMGLSINTPVGSAGKSLESCTKQAQSCSDLADMVCPPGCFSSGDTKKNR